MTKNFLKIIFSLTIVAVLIASMNVAAQNSMGDLSPQMINQLKTMTPEQQQQLALRYNIQLPLNGGQAISDRGLGQKSEPIEKFLVDGGYDDSSKDQVPSLPVTDNKLQRFGLSFFSQEISTFSPVDDASVPGDYVLGVGDSIAIQMMGTTTERYDVGIARDGSIFIESLGVISIAGLSMSQAVDTLEKRVANELFGTTVSINLGKLKAMNIFLAGEIKNPGMYSVSALTSVTQALYQAGGITELGSIRNIQVLRNGEHVNTFDAYDLLIKGSSTNDIRLKSGDVVLIPPYQSIAEVRGESRRPMLYEITEGETVADLVKMSSGFAENASPSDSVLLTQSSAGSPLNAMALNLLNQNDLETVIGMNDVLIIPKANITPRNFIEITGAAHRTGLVAWEEGMHLRDIITDINKDFPQYIDLDFSMIVRKPDRFSNLSFLNFSLRELFQNNEYEDIELFEFDQIVFFSSTPDEDQSNESIKEKLSSNLQIDNKIDDDEILFTKPNDLTMDKELSVTSKNFTRAILLKPIIDRIKLNSSLQNPMQLISISGDVPHPGIYPLFKNATAKDLIEAAGGFNDTAYDKAIELSRPVLESLTYSYQLRELNASNNDQELIAAKLEPLDHLTVRGYQERNKSRKVTLTGEFNFPGDYVINSGETILSVIERAGGFTDSAFIQGSVYLKNTVRLNEIKRLQEYSNQIKKNYSSSSLTQESSSSIPIDQLDDFLSMLEATEPSGRVAIDLGSSNLSNYGVEDGDSLHIPKKSLTVNVVGEVNLAHALEYTKELTIDDYLQLSGGLTQRADTDSLYIVKANGSTIVLDKSSFRIFGRKPKIEPGDTIVVPVNIQYKDSLTNWTQVTQLIYQSMVSIAAVKGL